MTRFDSRIGGPPDERGETLKPSAFDWLTRLVLPALSLLALIFTIPTGKQTNVQWALIALTILLVGVGFFPALRTKSREFSENRKDARVASDALLEFRKFVHRFGEFVDTRVNDSLHMILAHEALRSNPSELAKLSIPALALWNGFWNHFVARIDRQHPDFSELRFALMEFHHLVNSYSSLCVAPIFERLPQEMRALLTPEATRSLNSFQQRFDRFLANYGEFAKELAESRPALQGLPYFFSRPKPL